MLRALRRGLWNLVVAVCAAAAVAGIASALLTRLGQQVGETVGGL